MVFDKLISGDLSKKAIFGICLALWVLAYFPGKLVAAFFLGIPNDNISFIPTYAEIPLVLAPFITLFISFNIFFEYVNRDFGPKNLHYASCFIVLICCFLISYFPVWWAHLGGLFLLFCYFNFWDMRMLSDRKIDPQARQEVENGNRFINRPTLVAIVISFAFLSIGSLTEWLAIRPLYIGESLPKLYESNKLTASPWEMFTVGLIAFHLIVASWSYKEVSSSEDVDGEPAVA